MGQRTLRLGLFPVMARLLVGSACTGAPGGGPTTGPPAVLGFSATAPSGPAPLTTAFTWSIPTPETSFTCSLDLDDDDVFEVVIGDCTSASVRSATFDEPGLHPVRLRVTDGPTTATSAPLTLSVAPPSADQFDITFRFGDGVSPDQVADFQAAADRLEDVVATGLADTTISIPAGECVKGTNAYSGPVDDLLIDAEVAPIDGSGGVLASAGPCRVRPGGGLTSYGVIKFDSSDIAGLESSGQLADVVLHEMTHVLGFGIFWDSTLLAGDGTGDPRYVGPVAKGAWQALPGSTGTVVPVEAGGGPGTAYAHWRESVLDNELMTGFIDPGSNPFSELSIGALADLGYGVDLGAADPFGISAPFAASRSWPADGIELVTELLSPRR
jgi:hypothetical protein